MVFVLFKFLFSSFFWLGLGFVFWLKYFFIFFVIFIFCFGFFDVCCLGDRVKYCLFFCCLCLEVFGFLFSFYFFVEREIVVFIVFVVFVNFFLYGR